MKKITLITATALTLATFGGQALVTQAATKNCGQLSINCGQLSINCGQLSENCEQLSENCGQLSENCEQLSENCGQLSENYAQLFKNCEQLSLNDNCVIYTYGSSCDIQNIFDRLGNCFPQISLPNCNIPGTGTPEVNIPESSLPELNVPESSLPEVNIPESSLPEVNLPENSLPEVNVPETDDTTEEDISGENSPEADSPAEDTVHPFIREVVDLVNAERAKEGLSALTIDTNVQAAAMVRAAECEQLFSHTRPDGSSFSTALKEQNVSYRSAGENIAWGQRSPEEVMNAWMNSAGHRSNIMNPDFTTIGVGYYENENGTDYWCQLFTR